MKTFKYIGAAIIAASMAGGLSSCTNLDEKSFDRIDAAGYYQDENSVKGAVVSIYSSGMEGFLEYFWYLNEFSADQVAWRTWNGGAWGWDEAEKFVLSSHTWTSESVIIKNAWSKAWTTIGLSNTLIADLEKIDPAALGMTKDQINSYIAEVRTMRAWAYYNNFELWGGSLPLNTEAGGVVPGSASKDFNEGCNIIYNFIAKELDETWENLPKEDGSGNARNRMNQAMNRMLRMRLALNAEVLTGTPHFDEAATLAQNVIDGKYGTYSLVSNYHEIFEVNNHACPEIVFAWAQEDGQWTNNNRNTPYLPYNYDEFTGLSTSQGGWNCTCVVPSKDNSGNVRPEGGTDNPKSFILDYGDKLGGVFDRMNTKDIRRKPFDANDKSSGPFIQGAMKNLATGADVLADADRDGEPIVYVDQVGTFKNLGRTLETVMSPRWGETTSGFRYIKYPMWNDGSDWRNADQVEFRLAEAYYTLAECKMRQGDSNGAKDLVNQVRKRYFAAGDQNEIQKPGPGFTAFDMDWMLSEWGLEFMDECRRRRPDLRRFDKFTQGTWWFFGRATETDRQLPSKRDRKYEWFPIPQSALMVNPGLVQTPNY